MLGETNIIIKISSNGQVIKSSSCNRIIIGVSTILDKYKSDLYSFLDKKMPGIVISEVSPSSKIPCKSVNYMTANQLSLLPDAYMVIQPDWWSGSPTATAIAPESCIFLTFVINEQPPLLTRAIQSEQGGSTILHPVGSAKGSIK